MPLSLGTVLVELDRVRDDSGCDALSQRLHRVQFSPLKLVSLYGVVAALLVGGETQAANQAANQKAPAYPLTQSEWREHDVRTLSKQPFPTEDILLARRTE